MSASQTMKGIMFTEKGRTEFIDEPMPVCTEDALLLQTLYSGLSNGTERMFLVGGNYGGNKWPNRIGYQHVARVVECGSGVKGFSVGDYVATGTYPGHVPFYLARPHELLVKLPQDFDLPAGALMGLASVAHHDCRLAQITEKDNVLVFGGGIIGQCAAQFARLKGASVTLVDRHENRINIARQLGATAAIDLGVDGGYKQLERSAPFSVIMECSGGDVLDMIIGRSGEYPGLISRRSRARLVLVAGRYEVGYNFNAAGMAELQIIHTQHFDQEDFDQVAKLIHSGELQIRPLISHITPFAEAIKIYDTLRDNRSKLFGVVFDYGVKL